MPSARSQAVPLRMMNGGLVTEDSPAASRPQTCAELRNVELTSGGEWRIRGGLDPVIDNPPAAVPISGFEAAETAWTGGVVDTVNYRANEAGGAGVRGYKLTTSNFQANSVALTIASPPLVLGNKMRERFICFWVYWNVLGGSPATFDWTLSLRLYSGVPYFEKLVSSAGQTVRGGWTFWAFRMDDFDEVSGTPDWDGITRIELGAGNQDASGLDVEVTFDNLFQGPAAVMGLHQLQRSPVFGSDSFLYAYAETGIYVADPVMSRWTLLVPGLTRVLPEGPRMHFITYGERAWGVNGVDRGIQLLDANRWFYASMSRPMVPLVATDLGGGLLDIAGDTSWVFTWYNKTTGKESAPIVPLTAPTLAGALITHKYRIQRGEDPIPNEGATHWVPYRRDFGDSVYRRTGDPASADLSLDPVLGSFIPVAVQNFTDNIPHAGLGLELLTEDHLPMPILSAITEMSDSVVGVGAGKDSGTVFWNKIGYPEAWGLNDYQKLGGGDASPIQCVIGFASRMWAGRGREWYEGVPVSDGGWAFTARRMGPGSVSHAGASSCIGQVRYPSDDGFYELRGDGSVQKISLLVSKFWAEARRRREGSVSAYSHSGEQYLLATGNAGKRGNNLLIAYSDTIRNKGYAIENVFTQGGVGSVMVHDLSVTCLLILKDSDQSLVPIAALDTGMVCRLFQGENDLGFPIKAVYETPWLDFGHQTADKVLDALDIEATGGSNAVQIACKLFLDFSNAAAFQSTYEMDQSGGFGTFPLTFGPYGGFLRARAPNMGKFRRLKTRLEMTTVNARLNVGALVWWLHSKSVRYKL